MHIYQSVHKNYRLVFLALATDVYGISDRTVFKNIPDVYKKLLTIWDKSHIILTENKIRTKKETIYV